MSGKGHDWYVSDRFAGGGLDLKYWECSKCGAQEDRPNMNPKPGMLVRVQKGTEKVYAPVLKPTRKGREKYDYYTCEEWAAIQAVNHVHGR